MGPKRWESSTVQRFDSRNKDGNLHYTSLIIDAIKLDEFCADNGIDFIDFMKIDAEGHELEIFKGATRMINENRIGMIQFEFNLHNIYSRVFLRDFYNILPNYNIYRLDTERLIPIHDYSHVHEIFIYQNLLAIMKN